MDIEIHELFEKNKMADLKKFLAERSCINKCNTSLIYLFHILQSCGIFFTTFATSNNRLDLIWIGIGLNFLASLISVIEKTNHHISQQLLQDIIKIKKNSYVDEGMICYPNQNQSQNQSQSQYSSEK